ncbi:MAG: hypothetical protein V1799_08575 [bacterium]
MNTNLSLRNTILVFLAVLSTTSLLAQTRENDISINARGVTLGSFILKVPSDWQDFPTIVTDALRDRYNLQIEVLCRTNYDTLSLSKVEDIVAFHIKDYEGSFSIVYFKITPGSKLLNLLRNQAKERAKFDNHRSDFKYSDPVPINDERFLGFYTISRGSLDRVEISGSLEHKKLKNTLIQFTLRCPRSWDEYRASTTFSSIIQWITFKGN